MVLKGESFGTMTAPYSSISCAMGVVSPSVDSELLVYDAPTTPRPISISRSPLPLSFTVRARPTVPPAPSRLKTSVPLVMSPSSSTLAAVRAVTSYPPPGELGTMIRRSAIWPLLALVDVSVTPQAETADTARARPIAAAVVRRRLILGRMGVPFGASVI